MTTDQPEYGNLVTRQETCALATVRRVAAMLDVDPNTFANGDSLPRGWQFILLAADSRRSEIRSDGFPGLGVPLPDLGLPRLLLGGRSVEYRRDIPIGSNLLRKSRIQKVSHKETLSGQMAIVTIEHELNTVDEPEPALVEFQTYIMMSAATNRTPTAPAEGAPPAGAVSVTPDDTLLFQYSALGFNSHKIHLDRAYARETEGFTDLVVNGGLATLLFTEHFRKEVGQKMTTLRTKHLAPLFCARPISILMDRDGESWRLEAFDDRGVRAMEMLVTTA
ncbi:hypothetical protein GCM10010924_49460 [Rhizobium wenxiniae]|uniref:3-methylfumaryl-CoA hydratase n=1 Tax=Rhizobium wenxiniae TaxID=1737357 RepID=A0A7X0D278_9HYPH|nr:MaoC family dehydratase N-terminal domain-containing protein [Rhizobium wenxiniae]MBB6165310.1 3-methylfumaryl-CoA hydratase [Rhizobium wenxiniae]GGG14408.1 hypothetical protein GCM10010924_49460 [Rhizobium wenxiniae]